MTKFTPKELAEFKAKLQDLNNKDMAEFMTAFKSLRESVPELYKQMLDTYDQVVWHRRNYPGIRTEAA
jgi:hypothetical protein